jgi:hypothetical protein
MIFRLAAFTCALSLRIAAAEPAEIVVDFEQAVIGKPVTSWTEQDVVFSPAWEPTTSKAAGRVMFFPHLGTNRKGILNAMVTEPIPVQMKFPAPVSSVTVVVWGSTGCAALLEAFDQEGHVVDKAALKSVVGRAAPGDPEPFSTLTVHAPQIAFVRLSGPRAGEFLAADEVRFTPSNR